MQATNIDQGSNCEGALINGRMGETLSLFGGARQMPIQCRNLLSRNDSVEQWFIRGPIESFCLGRLKFLREAGRLIVQASTINTP